MKFLTGLLIAFMSVLIHTIPGEAQKKIRLTNKESNQEIFLKEGNRVKYVLNHQDEKVVGILKWADSDQLIVDEKTISIGDVRAIGRKKKGSGAFTFISAFIGGALIAVSLAPAGDCPDCQTDTIEKNSGKALGVIAGLSFAAIAVHIGAKNSMKDVRQKWQLDIVD